MTVWWRRFGIIFLLAFLDKTCAKQHGRWAERTMLIVALIQQYTSAFAFSSSKLMLGGWGGVTLGVGVEDFKSPGVNELCQPVLQNGILNTSILSYTDTSQCTETAPTSTKSRATCEMTCWALWRTARCITACSLPLVCLFVYLFVCVSWWAVV